MERFRVAVRISQERPLVLGSASPRRREILECVGVACVVVAARADEEERAGEGADAYLDRVVAAKLDAVRALALPASALGVLVADTIVIAPEGSILGKPNDADEALAMIERLTGRTHEVKTRFALAAIDARLPPLHAETVTTRVTFRPLDAGEARAYVATGEGMDKAGAYAVQGGASAFASRIDGSYTNVVGLPACEVVVALRRLGWL
jgi:septum formation protein